MQNPQSQQTPVPADAAVPAAAQVIELITTDPAEFESALTPWELWVKPNEAGDFNNRLLMLMAPDFMIYREWYNLALHIQGLSPPDMLGIGIPMGNISQDGLYWNIAHHGKTLPASLPGPVDGRLYGGHSQIIIFIHLDLIERELSPSLFEKIKHAAETHLVQAHPRNLQTLAAWANSLLEKLKLTPGLASTPATLASIKLELLDHLIMLAASLPPVTALASEPARMRGLRKAVEYLRHTPNVHIPMSNLCRVSGISERSLQYAFRDAFGMTPNETMLHRRLHFVRQALLLCDTKSASVTEVAMKFGFSELGRFANRYKRLFGELPSQTLTRNL